MPGGSNYQGPREALELYTAAVDAGSGDTEVKGAKNPYTSRNGHMFSFLDADGSMALRLSDELGEEFLEDDSYVIRIDTISLRTSTIFLDISHLHFSRQF